MRLKPVRIICTGFLSDEEKFSEKNLTSRVIII